MNRLEELRAKLEGMLHAGRRLTDPEVLAVSQELDRLVNEEMGISPLPMQSLRYVFRSLLVCPENEAIVREILDELENDCILVPEGEAHRSHLLERLRELGENNLYGLLHG